MSLDPRLSDVEAIAARAKLKADQAHAAALGVPGLVTTAVAQLDQKTVEGVAALAAGQVALQATAADSAAALAAAGANWTANIAASAFAGAAMSAPLFRTKAAALGAPVPVDALFLVPQAPDSLGRSAGADMFRVVAGTPNTAVFVQAVLFGSEGQRIAAVNAAAEATAPPRPRGMSFAYWGMNGAAYDGRFIPNSIDRSLPLPTRNFYSWIFSPINESTAGTPVREPFYTGLADPYGGFRAARLHYTAQAQNFTILKTTAGHLRNGQDIGLRAFMRSDVGSGVEAMRFGKSTGYAQINVAEADWTVGAGGDVVRGVDVLNYQSDFQLALATHTGNTDAWIHLFGLQMYDQPFATIPDFQTELDACKAGWLKRSYAESKSIQFGQSYGLVTTNLPDGFILALPNFQDPTVITAMTVGALVKSLAAPPTTAGNVICANFSPSTEFNTNNARFQIGVKADGSPYLWPNNIDNAFAFNMIGEGGHVIVNCVENGYQVGYLNGVPMVEKAAAWPAMTARALRVGSYNGVNSSQMVAQLHSAEIDGLHGDLTRAYRPAEAEALTRHIEAGWKARGGRLGLRKVMLIGCCDSITAFSNTWAWQLAKDTTLSPHLPFFCEAVGGSSLADWQARKERGLRAVRAAVRAGYEPLVVFLAGANEFDRWAKDGYNIEPWAAEFLLLVDEYRRAGAKTVIGYMIPRPDKGQLIENCRQALLAKWDAMWRERFDYRIQFGRHPILGSYQESLKALPLTGGDYTFLLPGGTHPADAGHALLANDPANPDCCARPLIVSRYAELTGLF